MTLWHRVKRLEHPGAGFLSGLADRLTAARIVREADPEGVRARRLTDLRRLEEVERAGDPLPRLSRRILAAHRRLGAVAL